MSSDFYTTMAIYCFVMFCLFLISMYIVRAIFNIPTIVRSHKAQVKLLQEIAKKQGVEQTAIQSIITEMNTLESM